MIKEIKMTIHVISECYRLIKAEWTMERTNKQCPDCNYPHVYHDNSYNITTVERCFNCGRHVNHYD